MLLPGVKKHSDYASEYSATLKGLHRMHQILTIIYLPLVIACMAFSCYFSYIHGAVSSYTDPGEDWEACLVVNNAMQVPLAPIMAEIGDKVSLRPALRFILLLSHSKTYSSLMCLF